MPRWVFILFFLLVAVFVLGGVHYYFYRRLVVDPALPAPWPTIAKITLTALAFSFPVAFFVSRQLGVGFGRAMLYPVYIWLGVLMMLFFLLLSIDVVRVVGGLVARLGGHNPMEADPERRRLIARGIAASTAGLITVATGFALWRGLGKVAVKKVPCLLSKLPAKLDGFTIVQLTDLHLGAMRHGSWVETIVAEANQLEPDLMVITGDLADATPQQLGPEIASLRRLRARHGVFFVTGNHEYFYDLEGWLRQLDELGVRVLRNERVAIEQAGASFDLAGVDDHDGSRMAPGHGPDVGRALRDRDPERVVVLLAHQPREIHQAAAHGVDLMLCGHTHGGQIFPWMYLVYLQQPYVSGWHDHQGTQIYVSEGTGFWGPPMRLGSVPEITLITLHSPDRAESSEEPR